MTHSLVPGGTAADSLVVAMALLQGDGEDGVRARRLRVHGGGAHGAGAVAHLQTGHHLTLRHHLLLRQTHDLHQNDGLKYIYIYIYIQYI